MSSKAIANGRPRDWGSGGGFRCENGGCDRAKAARRAEAEEETVAARSPARTCAECGASETPLWRGGPEGPKSLCNACGIKYRKRKKSLEPAARWNPSGPTGTDGQMREAPSPEELKKRQRSKRERMLKLLLLQHEKQRGRREEVKSTTAEHGQDVEEAARLLMSLSSGLSPFLALPPLPFPF